MIYDKPVGITITDMCIYIDETAYTDEHNENLIFEYLYHIIETLSRKAKYFKNSDYYEDFAIFGASRVYMRLINPKQFEETESDKPEMEKIKSILNYIKTVLYPLKVDFEQKEYSQCISKENLGEGVTYSFNDLIQNSIDEMTFCDFEIELTNVGNTCRKFLQTIPYDKNSSEWLNIYVSVMLTFLNSVTLTKTQNDMLEHLYSTTRIKEEHINGVFEQEKYSKPILYHLPRSMADYIVVLTRQLKKIVSNDLTYILHTKVSENFNLVNLSIAEYMEDCGGASNEY